MWQRQQFYLGRDERAHASVERRGRRAFAFAVAVTVAVAVAVAVAFAFGGVVLQVVARVEPSERGR